MVAEKAVRGLTTVNLRSLRLSSKPQLLRRYLQDLETVHGSYTCAPLVQVELKDIVGPDFSEPLFLPLGYVRPGSTPLGDLAVLASLARKKQPKEIFEIGTFEGLSTVVFLKNTCADARVHTLDLPNDHDVVRTQRSYEAHSIAGGYSSGHLVDRFGLRTQTEAIYGDSAIFDFTKYHNRIDLFFVDGAHTDDYVRSDSSNAFDCIAPDGWVLWHDCFTPQVLRALRKIAETIRIFQIRGSTLALTIGKPAEKLAGSKLS